jgi:hypothetical protein
MALTKEVVVDRMEILEDGQIQIRTATRIIEDGVMISQTNHRQVIAPGDDVSKHDERVKAVCKAVHTKDVVDAYKAKQSLSTLNG